MYTPQAQLSIRRIRNGYVVSTTDDYILRNITDGQTGNEQFFATLTELEAAAGGLVLDAISAAEADARRIAEEMIQREAQREYAGLDVADPRIGSGLVRAAQRRRATMPQNEVRRSRPTIAELEQVIQREGQENVEIHPDGYVEVKGSTPETDKSEIPQ